MAAGHEKFPAGRDLCGQLFQNIRSIVGDTAINRADSMCSIGGTPKFAYVYHHKSKIRVYLRCREDNGQELQLLLSGGLTLQKRQTMSNRWAKVTPYFIDLTSASDVEASARMIAHLAAHHVAGQLSEGPLAGNPLISGGDGLSAEISRLVNLIRQDVGRAETERTGVYPPRLAEDGNELFRSLLTKWHDQNGCCALCGGSIPLQPNNRLLQMSRDRVDSAVKIYDAANIQLTHLGCNLAKNDATITEWREFLMMLRHVNAHDV
jgi:hypothetical protein